MNVFMNLDNCFSCYPTSIMILIVFVLRKKIGDFLNLANILSYLFQFRMQFQ